MTTQKVFHLGVVPCFILILLPWLVGSIFPPSRITKAASGRIKAGMTSREVENILGPERDETNGRVIVLRAPGGSAIVRHTEERSWSSYYAAITVEFDPESNCVVAVWYSRPNSWHHSSWDRLREWTIEKFDW